MYQIIAKAGKLQTNDFPAGDDILVALLCPATGGSHPSTLTSIISVIGAAICGAEVLARCNDK
jgi:hypothetical protein